MYAKLFERGGGGGGGGCSPLTATYLNRPPS